MANFYAYLNFENAKESMDYYKDAFGATLLQRMPMDENMAKEWGISTDNLANTTIHGGFVVLGNTIFCSDRFGDGEPFSSSVTLMLDFNSEDAEDVAALDALYKRVTESGVEIIDPLKEQFWGGKMGIIKDKYGLLWMFHAQPYSKLQ
ncbi:VOC family protein [Listeria booriae]|uniref:Glyoxalase/bleomycin resistance/extradiol dioxygenase family protein n=1 Tax=Listeria booriae TaxID=1552123 RepID=A0A842AHY5_9LIST|nr:glyoxalase/bleomycin resistance/extradiol dioxygenase family protein [Listeria booriae]MBC1371703.1 glyoxalase/bleomycin resistance/extradiol dioxygenase family protein [Listeria booriae]MBC1400459.1 glyoxalase/bleomycin resistance/extradiol dioxygenase family protein [Listeria booriae]MBC1615815.1 glyoxalase/bleomycin resistance/extradiol dioxygenase family protein [Listeria booriae]MBC1649193.1 glyoxalase/bleomycin resistance/extradiol dioxygenase family protein [Listeria booriae]MBC23192